MVVGIGGVGFPYLSQTEISVTKIASKSIGVLPETRLKELQLI